MTFQGDVLEVSAGTGRNVQYYRHQHATSVVMTDTSGDMLWHATQKHEKHNAQLQAKFCLADAQNLLSESSSIEGDSDDGKQKTSEDKGSHSAPQQ